MQVNIGDIYEGKVTGLTNFGAFVKLSTGETGMVHISEVATSFVKDINEHLSEGQDVKVKVLSVNEAGKISLSIRQAAPKPAENKERSFKGEKSFDRNGKSAPKSKRPVQTWQGNHHEDKPQSFEDMMAKFKQTSDERQAGMKKPAESRRGGARRGNNGGANRW
ncbi:MAG: S1 RNA-binding domain-containing protein [Clostridia bacterium]|nr:S1 RNA-binding domain-containing protein [Clostridia bacterium]